MASSTKNFFFRFNRDQVSRFSMHRPVSSPLSRCYQCGGSFIFLNLDYRCDNCARASSGEF